MDDASRASEVIDAHVMSSLEAGASGYLLKDASAERIAAAVHELRAQPEPEPEPEPEEQPATF